MPSLLVQLFGFLLKHISVSPFLYSPIYIHLVLVLSIFLCFRQTDDEYDLSAESRNDLPIVLALSLFLILWLGLRPVSYVFGDTGNYAKSFLFFESRQMSDEKEWVFYGLMGYVKSLGLPVNVFFLIVEFFYIGGISYACIRGFGRSHALLPLVLTLASFSCFSYAVNGLRQGMACSLMLAALACRQEPKSWWPVAVLSFFAIHVHTSTMLLVGAIVLATFYKNTKTYFIAWIVCLLIGAVASGMTETIFSNVGLLGSADDVSYYDNNTADLSQFSKTGFRYDFMLYGSVPILVGVYFVLKEGFDDEWYKLLLNVYLISNCFWALVNQSWLSNRVAYLSWCSYGLVIAYPLIMSDYIPDRRKKLTYALLGNIAFTYFMWLIGK